MTVGHAHAVCVDMLRGLASGLERLGVTIRIQQPLALPPDNAPEPDGAIVVGQLRDYLNSHPGPRQVTSVIEVSDSSLAWDREVKLAIYARAGIEQYLIINLVDHWIEQHGDPVRRRGIYRSRTIIRPAGRVRINATGGRSLTVAARKLLP